MECTSLTSPAEVRGLDSHLLPFAGLGDWIHVLNFRRLVGFPVPNKACGMPQGWAIEERIPPFCLQWPGRVYSVKDTN